MVNIYTLSHPITGEIRYVGKTKFAIEKRLKYGHLRDLKFKNKRVNWIKSLISQGLLPKIELLEVVEDNKWIEREIYWIKEFRDKGYRLTNMTDGGDGNNNQQFSEETIRKRSMAVTGQKRTEEQKQRMSKAMKGIPKSKEHIEKLRNTLLIKYGRPVIKCDLNENEICEYDSIRKAAKECNVDRANLMRACNSNLKKVAKGYKWKYKN